MGASASRSSSSPPTSRGTARTQSSTPPTSLPMAKTEYSETRLFKLTEFSESALLPPGSTLALDTFRFRGQDWRVDLRPVGSLACPDSVTVSVAIVADHGWNSAENTRTRVSVEILDERGERAVFGHQRTQSERNQGFGFLSVGRTELEASSCIRENTLTVRCTLSVDVFLEREADLAGSNPTVEPGIKANVDRVGAAAAGQPATTSSSGRSPAQPKCGFGWLAGGRLRRGRLRDAYGVRRYRHVDSWIDDASTRDTAPNQTELLY